MDRNNQSGRGGEREEGSDKEQLRVSDETDHVPDTGYAFVVVMGFLFIFCFYYFLRLLNKIFVFFCKIFLTALRSDYKIEDGMGGKMDQW